MSQTAQEMFMKQDHSCAETVFKVGCARAGLTYSEDTVKALGSFSGGCGVGHLCGACAGALGVIGIKYGSGIVHQSQLQREKMKEFMAKFQERYKDTMCSELVKVHKKPDTRCLELVEETLELLKSTIND